MVSPQRRASSASPASSSSDSSASSDSSQSSASTTGDAAAKSATVPPTAVAPSAPRAWRFLDTEETCHFFNTEIVVGTNDVRQVDLDDLSDESGSEDDELGESDAEIAMAEAHEPAGCLHEEEGEQLPDPMQTTYEGIYSEFDDLYLPGVTTKAPKKMRLRRASQRREAAQVLSAFSKELQTGQSYLYRKRSEFLRVCFQRALELNKDHDTQETAENARSSPLGSPPRGQTVFRFQCSRLERPIDVTTPELYPRKWPHLPYRDPREWKNDPAAIVTFAQRVNELPEGSLLYEPIDVHEFTERCCELLKEEGVDVWSTESGRDIEPSDTAAAILVAILSVGVRLQSFSLLLLVSELLVRVGKSSVFVTNRWGKELAAVVGNCMKTLQAFLHTPVPPATYPRALISQWKLCAYQPSTSDAIATDGLYLYIYGRSGLLKVGTGRGSTLRDFVYEHNKSYRRSRDAERSWLCLIGDYLYCRSIVMPSSRVDRIHTSNLREVDELVLAPSSKVPEAVTASSTVYAMVTDGTDLLTIHSIDTHAVSETGAKKSRSSKAKKTSSSQAAKALAAKATNTPPAGATIESSGGVQVGDRVIRGPDWKWGAQDGEKGSPGTVERISTWGGVKGCGVTVRWDKNQRINTYRWGAEACYDIVVVVEKAGGGLEKKPLPDKSAARPTKNEPIAPRHRFVVTRYGVAKLLCVVDLEREAANAFLGLRPKAEVGVSKPVGDVDSLLTAVHEHTLGISSATSAWMCDGGTLGCLGDNSGVRYRCESGCDFDLCDVCLANTLIEKQVDPQKSADGLTSEASVTAGDGNPSEAKPSDTEVTTEDVAIPAEIENDALSAEDREAVQVDDLATFWCGLFSRRECQIALQRADYSVENAITWLSECGHELRRRVILSCINSFTLESPPNSSGLDPVLLVAGSFYAIDGQLCIVSPPGLYQGDKPKRSTHASDAAWFFLLKDGALLFPKSSPILLKSVPAGSPVCADLVRRRILVFSGYLNCVEEYSIPKAASESKTDMTTADEEVLARVGERIYAFMQESSDQRYAWRAFKRPWQGLQEWISQLQQEGVSSTAAYVRDNVKTDQGAAKVRTRRIKKLRVRMDEFEKLGRSGERGYFVPYCVDFSDCSLRGLLAALNRATKDFLVFGDGSLLRLRRVSSIWRGFLGDCIASDVVLQTPGDWSEDVQCAMGGLQKIVFGNIGGPTNAFFQGSVASQVVYACQDVLLWGIDVGLFEGLDRCDLLIDCLRELLDDTSSSKPLPSNYFELMHDSLGEIRLRSSGDCSIAFIRRVLALNVEATDGGIAGLVYERCQVEDLITLLFKLSAREFGARVEWPSGQAIVGSHAYTPVEKGLLALFNGCAIDLLASADVATSFTPPRRRLSSIVAEESMFHMFATTCLRTCEELVTSANLEADDAGLCRSVCGKLLPLVLAMVCNGGRGTLTSLKDQLLRLSGLVAASSTGREKPHLVCSSFLPPVKSVESSHPYARSQGAVRKVVRIPGATCLHIDFDPRCSTSGEADFVFVTPGHAWFHSDRVPFGENGIGDAGGCFFGGRQSGNWPQVGRGISVWGDTATIMLCSTSQDRQGTLSAEEESRRWGLKCVVRGVKLGGTSSWRSDTLIATEHALCTLVQRQMSLCGRTQDAPLLVKAEPLLRTLRGLESTTHGERGRLVREIMATTKEKRNSDGANLLERYESAQLAKGRNQNVSGRTTPAWKEALQVVLATVVASTKRSEADILSQNSIAFQSVLRTMAGVEQSMIRRVQLLKEWSFLLDDDVPMTLLVERLSTDTVRLKEMCVLKDVPFFESDPKRSATNLHGILVAERASGVAVRATDYREEVAHDIIERARYALQCAVEASPDATARGLDVSDPSPAEMLRYLTSTVSAVEVRLADECLSGALRHAMDAIQLVQETKRRVDVPMTLFSTTTGMFGSCWNEHTAERVGLARWPHSVSSSNLISSWASEICHNLRNVNLSYSIRVAAISDFLAAYAQLRSHLSTSALQQYVAAVSDLLLDVERPSIMEVQLKKQGPEDHFIEELVWIGYRYGIDTMFMEGDSKGAVSALREMVGRLLSMPAGRSHTTVHSLQWKSLARVMRIASSHVQSISLSPVAAMAWIELCTAQILHIDFATSVHVQVASLRTVFAMAQISSTTVKPSIAAVMLEHGHLIGQLLERIGLLQSTVKFTSDETENKLKDCGVVLLENEKSKLKIVDLLEAVDGDTANSVYLPLTLSGLDLSDNPPLAPISSGESVESDIEHRNVRCDGCSQSPIRGFRFKCFTCANYDLCGTCYANQSMHSLDHQFVRLARSTGAGELLQPRSKVNGTVVPEAPLVGSKQWMGSVLRAALDAYGYSVLCRGSSEDCLRKAKALSAAGFVVTVMEWPDVKDLEDFYDWNSTVQATLEPGSARLSRRSSSANASTSRKMDRSVVSQFNRTLRTTTRRHELRDARSLLAELVGFTRYLMNQEEVLAQTGPLVEEIVDALKGLGTQVPLSTVAERALFHRTLGLTSVLGGFVATIRQGARVKSSDPEASKHPSGIVKEYTDASQSVSVLWCSRQGLSDNEELDLASKHSPLQLEVVAEVDVANVPQEVFTSTSFFPAFAATLKAAHKLLKSSPLELAQSEGHVAATELVVSWLRMFMASMEKLPSLLDSRASPGNGSGNMALLLFQLAKTSKSCGSFESLDASRSVLWHAQQVMLSDCQFKLASRPITTAEVGQNAASIFGPGANGVTDLTEYVFNLYAHSSRSQLPKHSGRNKLLEYWEKNVIPAIEAYVAGSFKSYEMDYFFAQLREPLREGNQAAAMKIAFTLCDGHVPSGCHYPDPDTDWSALQLDDIEVGARYLITDGSATSDQADWPMEMRWTVGHSGVVRTICPNGLILMQLWNPRTACLEHWWFHVENLATCTAGSSFSERSVDNYESTLADLLKLDMELLGAIARKCVFSMLRHSPEQFPLVSDRQAATKTHFNIIDILRMAGGAELGCEAKTLVGEAEVGRSPPTGDDLTDRTSTAYDLMDSLRFVLTKRFEFVPAVTVEDAVTTGELKPLSPMNQANKTKLAKSGKTPGGHILSPQKTPQELGVLSSVGLAVVKYRYTLIEALVQELKRSLDSSALFSQQSAFTVLSDSPPNPLIMLKVPGASCFVISFAVHPVLMDLPAGSSLEFFRDERCTKRIFGFFGDKRGLNFLPPLVVAGDTCFVRASQASYARYKFRVDPLTSDFGLAMWIGNELYQRMLSVTLSGFELESIVSSALNAITDYLVNGIASLPPCTKGVVCQLLTKMINFAINRSMSNSVPLSKLSALTREFAVAYDHELSAQKGLFSLPTQQLGELLATVEEVARLRGTTSISLSTAWWPNLVRFATFTRALTHKRDSGLSTDILARVSSGRTPVEAIDEAARMLQDRDLLCERMILLQKLPQTKRLPELETALSRFVQHLALEECGEADDQTVLSATEVVRFGVLGKVVHLPVDANGDTVGYAVVDVGRHDIIPRLLLRLQKEQFQFDGNPTEEDSELAEMLNGRVESVPTESESEAGDGVAPPSDDTVWSCGVCTLENPATEIECAACGSPMPSDAMNAVGRRQRVQSMRLRNALSQDQGGTTGGHATSGDDESSTGWHCEACTLVNPWATFECGACGSERNPSLVEPSHPSTRESGESVDVDAPGAKTVLHSLSGFSLADLLKVPATQNVRQVTTFLVEQFTMQGSELRSELAQLVGRELTSVTARRSDDGDTFVRKVAAHCEIENFSDLSLEELCAKLLEVTSREPIKVYEWLRESGFDLNVEPNHYTLLESARASQAQWTHAMDVQLVVLARQVGSAIGVLSLMDLCPSHLCSSHVNEESVLSRLESRDLRLRFVLLKTFNKMTLEVLPMVNLRNLADPSAFRTRVVTLRQLLFPAVKIRFFAETQDHANLAQSNLMDATVKRPVVTLDRRQISAGRLPWEPLLLNDPKKSLFAATMAQLSQVKPSILRAKRPTGASDPFVAFIVVFAGENVVGEGGPYRQLFNDIATELLSPGNPLFLPTQNSAMKIGEYRDRFLPNPSATTRAMLKMYEFVGVLLGCCVRTGVRLNIRLAPIIWKLLVKQSLLTMVDLEHIDFSVCESLKFIEAAAAAESSEHGSGVPEVYFDSFTTALSDGTIVELKPGGANVPVTKLNCREYVTMAKAARFQECKPQVDAMLRGIGTIVPIHLLQLCTWVELQQWVCGSLAVDVDLLKRHTLYSSGMTPEKFPHLDMFWRVLHGFSEENKRRFINFAWGQDTLPADDAEFDRTHTRLLIKAPPVTTASQDALLPKADTCFFNIELPAYSSEDIMREKLKLAITMCTSMDGDEQTGRMDLYFSTDAMDDDHME